MTVCIAGKNNIAVDCCHWLLREKLIPTKDLVVCVNGTDVGEDGFQKSLKKFALIEGIPVVQPEQLYSTKELLFISLEFDKIIDVNKFESQQLFNIHFSLLPKYRGVYTSAWPILNGEKESGVTLHRIDSGIDTGPVVKQVAFDIESSFTARDLYLEYIHRGTELFKANFKSLLRNNFETRKQNDSDASYYNKNSINYDQLVIDLEQSAQNIARQIRAFSFKEYQLPSVFGKDIQRVEILESSSGIKAGTVIESSKNEIKVATRDYDVCMLVS